MRKVTVIGAGPAGSAAAIEACRLGASVRLIDPAAFPRHRVCGEYITPEAEPLLRKLGVWNEFQALAPHRCERFSLHFPRASKSGTLPQAGFGLSRYRLDHLLWSRAVELGAEPVRKNVGDEEATPKILAHGRKFRERPGHRMFGFKAHYDGPQTDSTELFFFDRSYVGVSCVEGGLTNVCGLGPEDRLHAYNFAPDEMLMRFPPLGERLQPLRRMMDWMTTGPLLFQHRLDDSCEEGVFPAGDCLSFVDPFTGSGITSALFSGISAAKSHVEDESIEIHLNRCRRALQGPFLVSSILRAAVLGGWAEAILPLVPGYWLIKGTRPQTKIR